MKNFPLAVLLTFVLFGCGAMVPDDTAIRAAEDQGYSNIRIIETHYLAPTLYGGANSDEVVFDAEATNPLGKKVRIKICGGWLFKSFTVRTY